MPQNLINPDKIKIRLMTQADLPFADSVRALAGWNQTLSDWRRLLAHDPLGCFIAEWDRTPAGTVTTTRYGPELAWIGMLLVHPDFRRRGIGQALLRKALTHLQNSRVKSIKLDATPAGQPLYEKLGFQREWTLNRWERAPQNTPELQRPWRATLRRCPVRPFATADLEAIVRLDALALGASRREWLRALVNDARAIVCESNGRVCAFGVLRQGSRAAYLGPVIALDHEPPAKAGTPCPAASTIVTELLSTCPTHQPVFWDVPELNLEAARLVREHQFTIQRPLVRMFHGQNVEAKVNCLYAIAGPEVG